MRKLFFSILIVWTMLYIGAAHAALPDWILPELKKYPIEKYLFHVGEGQGTGEHAFENAVGDAHRRIASDILKNVDRVIRLNKDELEHDMVREHYSAVLEDYCDSRQAWPAMQLKGFHVRNLNVYLARKDPNTYGLVYIEREKLKEHYAEHVSELSKDINRLIDSAKFEEEAYEIDSAVQKYLQTYRLYEALKEAKVVQIGAAYRINWTEAFKELAKGATGTSSLLKMSHREVIKRVAELDKSRLIVFHEDIVKATEFQLSPQLRHMHRECWIEPLIYEDSQMICRYDQKFSEALLRHLGWPIVKPPPHFKPIPHDLAQINRMSLPNRITYSCWENGDEITIRTTVRDPNTGNFLATAVVRFLEPQLREPIDFQPADYEPMRAEIVPYDIPVTRGEKLVVEVWTHEGRGRGPLRYIEDEKVKIFVQVNQSAYVRLLYTLADRKRTVLEANYHIDESQVNSAVEIGEFLCAAPFGTELLVAIARTEKFPPIETFEGNGYFYIAAPDAESAAQRFRGLKVIPEPDPDPRNDEPQPEPTFQQNEAQIVVTTVAK